MGTMGEVLQLALAIMAALAGFAPIVLLIPVSRARGRAVQLSTAVECPVDPALLGALLPEDRAWLAGHGWEPPEVTRLRQSLREARYRFGDAAVEEACAAKARGLEVCFDGELGGLEVQAPGYPGGWRPIPTSGSVLTGEDFLAAYYSPELMSRD